MNRSLILMVIFFLALSCAKNKVDFSYRNPQLPPEKRAELLLRQMTLDEKAAQVVGRGRFRYDTIKGFSTSGMSADLRYGAGSVWIDKSAPLEKQAAIILEIQNFLRDSTRLGIPAFTFCEGLHGLLANGATSFPQALGLASSWDTALVRRVFDAAAHEMRVSGYNNVLSPVVDLARDPRWGRTEETYSEDPYLTARLAVAAVKGFQGEGFPTDSNHVVAMLKHFAGHGQPEGGRNLAPVEFGERTMRETHLYPFEIAVKEAKAQSIMASYNDWDGVPNHVNQHLMLDILRNDWGYDGYVASDGGAFAMLFNVHYLTPDTSELINQTLAARIGIELGHDAYFKMADMVRAGKINIKHLDNVVREMLIVKFRAGLFDTPPARPAQVSEVVNNAAHKNLAMEAARKSIVLLKNEGNILPFDSLKIKRLAVIGPNAADIHLGGYSYEPRAGVSVLEGIKSFAKNKFEVVYAEGCRITKGPASFYHADSAEMNDPADDYRLIAEARQKVKGCDMIVLVIGENETTNREAWGDYHLGDRDNLDLIGRQNELVKAMLETGIPVVVYLINGRPLSINYVAENVPAIIEGWYMGQETGHAVAEVLFGKVNPSGKLTVTFPRSVGQLPCFYNHKPTHFREYIFSDSKPLYPFGYGMSYTRFEYRNFRLTDTLVEMGSNLQASLEVHNVGSRQGDEIVQLYIRDKYCRVARPKMELKDFRRITIEAGKSKVVEFEITPEKLQFYDENMKRVVEPGEFEVMIGPNSQEVTTMGFRLIKDGQ